MLEMLIKQFMPADFDMEKASQAIAIKAQEITALVAMVQMQSKQIADLTTKVDFLTNATMSLTYRFEPDARPVEGWCVHNGKTGAKHLSEEDPKGLITPEEIADNSLDIYPVFKL